MELRPLTPERRAELFSSPFVASFAAQARPGDRSGPQAAAAWASWFLRSLVEVGVARRQYVAVTLDGRLYHNGELRGPAHLELPDWLWSRSEPQFPQRLAAAGQTLQFPSFLYDEVISIRRAMLTLPTSVSLPARLESETDRLRKALTTLTGRVAPLLPRLDLVSAPGPVSDVLRRQIVGDELARLLPAASGWHAKLDSRLVERSGHHLARRVHVWTLAGEDGTLPVVTPRLTVNSLTRDPLLSPDRETPAAALLRLVVLTRLAELLEVDPSGVMPPEPPADGFLRTVPARTGHRTPEAGATASAAFCIRYPDPHAAYEQLQRLIGTRFVATIDRERFTAAHQRIIRHVQRAEDPARNDVDTVLPLLITSDGEVARVTFARRTS